MSVLLLASCEKNILCCPHFHWCTDWLETLANALIYWVTSFSQSLREVCDIGYIHCSSNFLKVNEDGKKEQKKYPVKYRFMNEAEVGWIKLKVWMSVFETFSFSFICWFSFDRWQFSSLHQVQAVWYHCVLQQEKRRLSRRVKPSLWLSSCRMRMGRCQHRWRPAAAAGLQRWRMLMWTVSPSEQQTGLSV